MGTSRNVKRWRITAGISCIALLAPLLGIRAANAMEPADPGTGGTVTVTEAVAHDTSPPLRDMPSVAEPGGPEGMPSQVPSPEKYGPQSTPPAVPEGQPAPSGVTALAELPPMPPTSVNFYGVQNPDGYYPPDTVGDIGPNHYVQMVNISFTVFDREGNVLFGPVANNTLWGGFGGQCQLQNDGDPIVRYDGLADRWVLSQFAVRGEESYECVAVSATPDPLGPYHRYAFSFGTTFPDYPKLGVWPDAYYATYNVYDFTQDVTPYTGATTCAMDRAAMLVGKPATQQCFHREQAWSLLPSDLDGPTPPPAGSPNYLIGTPFGSTDLLNMYRFAVDWDNPAASTFEGPINISVTPFTQACVDAYSGQCVPQPDTDVLLDSLGGRTMFRLAYRNFGTHESLVTNQTVALDGNPGLSSQLGVAWYEIRTPGTTPTVFQEGIAASEVAGQSRWMGSIAMDSQGNMGLGYSSASSTLFPSINYLGRLASDPAGTMPYEEGLIQAGEGSQTGDAGRWGDYTSMDVDPLDDCTFWYTNEYLLATDYVEWSTRVAAFKFPGCNGSTSVPSAPLSATAQPGNASATVQWQAPADDGGLPINGYTVTAKPGGATCTTVVGSDADPLGCTVTGLTNGEDYTFEVIARNALGVSPVAPSNQATPSAPPQPPTDVVAQPRESGALVSWQAPADTGGIPVASYTVTATPGGATCTTEPGSPAPTSCLVTGLENGTPYTFTVTAEHALGVSSPSEPSAPVVPGVIGAEFFPVTQQRVYDSRLNGGPVNGGAPRLIALDTADAVPPEATAVAYNLTVTGQTAAGFATVTPASTPDAWQPSASTINWVRPAQTIANGYVAKTTEAAVKVFVGGSGSTQVVLDVVGFYAPPGVAPLAAPAVGDPAPDGSVFVPVPPQRVYSSAQSTGPISGGPGGALGDPVPVDLSAVIPEGAAAVAFNLTATDAAGTGYLLVGPTGEEPASNVSTLNWSPGLTLANASVSKAGVDRAVNVYAGGMGQTQFILDVVGYFVPAAEVPAGEPGSQFFPIDPTRAYDSRTDQGLLLANPGTGGLGNPRTVPMALGGLLPVGTKAIAYNLTATGSTGTGYLAVAPSRDNPPATSALNWTPGTTTVANGSTTSVDDLRRLTMWAGGRTGTQAIIDVGGYYR